MIFEAEIWVYINFDIEIIDYSYISISDPLPHIRRLYNKSFGMVCQPDTSSGGDRYIIKMFDGSKYSINSAHLSPVACYYCESIYLDCPLECFDGSYILYCNVCGKNTSYIHIDSSEHNNVL